MESYVNEEAKNDEFKALDIPLYMPIKSECEEAESAEIPSQDLQEKKTKKRSFLPLITLQLIVCLLLAFCVFILKSMNSEMYYRFRDWYDSQMSYILINSDVFDNIDLSSLINSEKPVATDDEV